MMQRLFFIGDSNSLSLPKWAGLCCIQRLPKSLTFLFFEIMQQLKPVFFTFYWIILFLPPLQSQQVADSAFSFDIKNPIYARGMGPVITLDEAHSNFHTLSGRYYPFGQLLQKDGYILKSGHEAFSSSYLSGLKILVIANALSGTGLWRLPTRSAFSKDEILSLNQWVSGGGSLLLIADHMPFAGAAAQLALSFGFNFIDGFAHRKDDNLEMFSRGKNNLASSRITNGRNNSERIDSILFFTGQSFIAPKDATVISFLNDDYEILLPEVAWQFNDTTPRLSGQGLVNGAYMEYGKGRVVVMGEAAMFSAQVSGPQRNKAGMNHSDARQNPQFLLNLIHWLDRKL